MVHEVDDMYGGGLVNCWYISQQNTLWNNSLVHLWKTIIMLKCDFCALKWKCEYNSRIKYNKSHL